MVMKFNSETTQSMVKTGLEDLIIILKLNISQVIKVMSHLLNQKISMEGLLLRLQDLQSIRNTIMELLFHQVRDSRPKINLSLIRLTLEE